MADATLAVSAGSGSLLHTNTRTISAATNIEEYVLPGEYPVAAYTVSASTNISGATAGDDILQIMAGASLNVRLRRIRITQSVAITTAAEFSVKLFRLTAAGTGGTAITPQKLDNADAAAGATAQYGVPNATHGTAGAEIDILRIWPIQTASASGVAGGGPEDEWSQHPLSKPLIIPAGTSNGIVLRVTTGRAGLSVTAYAEFVETSFV